MKSIKFSLITAIIAITGHINVTAADHYVSSAQPSVFFNDTDYGTIKNEWEIKSNVTNTTYGTGFWALIHNEIDGFGDEIPVYMLNIDSRGRVGIGTWAPKEKVDVRANNEAARFQLTSVTEHQDEAPQFIQRRANGHLCEMGACIDKEPVESGDNIGLFSFRGWTGSYWTGSKAVISVAATEDWDDASNGNMMSFRHTPNGSSTMVTALQIKGHGDVYVPNGNLYVKGHKMHVPDYVFKEDYKLMPLDELKAYVQKNNHLPGVVSADEVDKAGVVNLSGLQMTLLEKVEELTLYTLQQEEALREAKTEFEKKDAELSDLKAKDVEMNKKIAKLETLLLNLTMDTSSADKTKVSLK